MTDKDNELNLDQLDDVTGGVMPYYPSGIKNGALPKNKVILNTMSGNIVTDNLVKTANPVSNDNCETRTTCPVCKSELRHDLEANVLYCTGCSYTKDLNI